MNQMRDKSQPAGIRKTLGIFKTCKPAITAENSFKVSFSKSKSS